MRGLHVNNGLKATLIKSKNICMDVLNRVMSGNSINGKHNVNLLEKKQRRRS